MLPEITLRDVSRDDVDRVSWWLEDRDLSSRWFGHYGCGDPVHRGYDPQHMLDATGWEWNRVFDDPHRLISSILSENEEHIGEAQVVLDGEGGAELTLLIGRKDLWHHGYGTATVLKLLDKVFDDLKLERAWVNVPEDNSPALGLFQKLGFVQERCREICKRPDGSALHACILAIDAQSYGVRQPGKGREPELKPVVTITGLPGSRSEAVAEEVAKKLGSQLIDDEITEKLLERLQSTPGELEAFEASFRSMWSRLLSSVVVPMEWSASYDAGYQWFRPEQMMDHTVIEDQISRKQYLEGLAGVVRQLAVAGNLVMHGHGSHLFVPASAEALNVFVSATPNFRRQHIEQAHGLESEEADIWMRQTDKQAVSVFKQLFGSDLLDMGRYDLTVNMDRLSSSKAARVIVGALKIAAPTTRRTESAPASPAVSAI